ncbi:MAG: hypothetical protein MI862_28575 [Desulfobacterales bacterium]|nr:hypothetical protein [Desulfobacterales bacterium]
MENKPNKLKIRCEIWGWVLFIISALFFIGSSLKSKDLTALSGGIFFFIACLVFLVPYIYPAQK